MAEFILGSFEDFRQAWRRIYSKTSARVLFSSPDWSELWWRHFAAGSKLCLGAVMEGGEIVGIAPLRMEGQSLHFIGNSDVCDFLDFVIEDGREELFFQTLLRSLTALGSDSFDLYPVLPESSTRRFLIENADKAGLKVSCTQDDVTVYLELPSDLPSYLALLGGKQRHEILRKERRLNEEGETVYRTISQPDVKEVDTFLRFFRESREDKNRFLTEPMEAFFRDVIALAASNYMLSLGLLELNSSAVAVTLCFNYRNDVYLYNSGYNPEYRWLSVGLLSKYFCIKQSIENNKRNFDLLKGAEKYKYHLGGKDKALFRCIIKN